MAEVVARTPAIGDQMAVEHGRMALSSIQAAERILWLAAFGTNNQPLDTQSLGASTEWTDITVRLTDLMNRALQEKGQVEVLFLGDLKPKTYPFESISFFHLATSSAPHEAKGVLRRAIAGAGGEEASLVNMANVREINIKAGSAVPGVSLQSAIATIQRFVETVSAWMSLGYSIIVED